MVTMTTVVAVTAAVTAAAAAAAMNLIHLAMTLRVELPLLEEAAAVEIRKF